MPGVSSTRSWTLGFASEPLQIAIRYPVEYPESAPTTAAVIETGLR
jgi:hypothetical protein